jgi:hypothetical protein
MTGHAGFAATPPQMRRCLESWIAGEYPRRMAVDTAQSPEGAHWGLGLQRCLSGTSRFGQLLSKIPKGFKGIHVLVSETHEFAPELLPEGPPEKITEWWMHFGFTGPALFVRPEDEACICLLMHRRGPSGELLNAWQLQCRRWAMLEGLLAEL